MEYQFKPVSKTCHASGNLLEPGSTCYSVIVEENGKLTRLDYSSEAWQGPPEDAVGYWQTSIPEENAGERKVIDPNTLMAQLEQLCEEANPLREQMTYVLALLLVQKRRLQIDETETTEDGEMLIFSGRRGEGPFRIRDQQLSQDEIRRLQNELQRELLAE